MKKVCDDKDTITVQFSREEAAAVRAAVNYVSSLFEYLDREALDGWRMTMDEADQIADDFTNLTTGQLAQANPARGV